MSMVKTVTATVMIMNRTHAAMMGAAPSVCEPVRQFGEAKIRRDRVGALE